MRVLNFAPERRLSYLNRPHSHPCLYFLLLLLGIRVRRKRVKDANTRDATAVTAFPSKRRGMITRPYRLFVYGLRAQVLEGPRLSFLSQHSLYMMHFGSPYVCFVCMHGNTTEWMISIIGYITSFPHPPLSPKPRSN